MVKHKWVPIVNQLYVQFQDRSTMIKDVNKIDELMRVLDIYRIKIKVVSELS